MPPTARPLGVAPGYGLAETASKALSWAQVEERLVASRNYWVASTRPDGRPHAAPVWGVWRDGALWFSTDRESVKGRNLLARPSAVVHLESGDDVVILEGEVAQAPLDDGLRAASQDYDAKYGLPLADEAAGDEGPLFLVFRPLRAMTWLESDFVDSATGWDFGG